MTHVQRLWLLCLAHASATANQTFGNAQTIVSDMARKAQLLGVLLRLGGAWAFPSRTGVNNHQNWGANPQALAAIQSTDGSIACWGRSEYGGGGCPTDTGYQALYSSGILLVVALAVHLVWLGAGLGGAPPRAARGTPRRSRRTVRAPTRPHVDAESKLAAADGAWRPRSRSAPPISGVAVC